jgi:hypothetical protein
MGATGINQPIISTTSLTSGINDCVSSTKDNDSYTIMDQSAVSFMNAAPHHSDTNIAAPAHERQVEVTFYTIIGTV